MSDVYAVLVRSGNTLLGRLTPEGGTTNRNIYACMFRKETAEEVAQEINNGVGLTDDAPDKLSAKVVKF